jgi:HlyD family secretion protein
MVTAVILLAACTEQQKNAPVYESAAVTRDTIEVSVGSAGIIEPLATVEVKSKASGEVLELLVETGDLVEPGTLLVRIDPRTVGNRLNQADAELKAAEARRRIAITQLERVESLVTRGTLTAIDREQAALEAANAEAQVVTATVNVENARIAVDDTEIRAPVAGTVIEKPVEKGQVISSPTQDVGGGTLLLKMADLSAVQVRALVDETDIGKVSAGLPAQVTVAAYPNQPFNGNVIKIEPQAVLDQNVTMFAVLVSIQNTERLLKPGMNADVEVSIARRENVLTVPVMALRTDRDVTATAGILGMSEAQLRARLANGGGKEQAPAIEAQETMTVRGRTITLPEGVSADDVRELMQKRQSGGSLSADERKLMRSLFSRADDNGRAETATDYRFGGDFWVVVDGPDGPQPLTVRAGITDLERVEIVSDIGETDRVLILPSAHLVETQEQLQQFIKRRVGGVPGIGSR